MVNSTAELDHAVAALSAISKHLRVLEEADVIVRVVDGREHRLSLKSDPLEDASDWIYRQRRLWERKFDVIERYLEERKQGWPSSSCRSSGNSTLRARTCSRRGRAPM